MKRGYFINCMSYTTKENLETSGVYKKVVAQCKELGKYTELIHELHNMQGKYIGFADKIIRRLPYTAISERWKYDKKYEKCDFIYFRKDVIDYSVYKFLLDIKKNNPKIKIIMEIATYPYDKEIDTGIKNKIFFYKDIINRNKLHRCVDRVVTYSNDSEIFKIKTINTINGFDFESVKLRIPKKKEKHIMNIVCVSSYAVWHGYDRLIQGLVEYYTKQNGKRKIVCHMVGDGPELSKYKKIVRNNQLGERIIFYGKKFGKELNNIYDNADIGVASLGLHRLGLQTASTLKAREYAAKGLPIVTASPIDFMETPNDYLLIYPANDEPLDIEKLVEFYDRLYNTGKSPLEIANQIREQAKAKCDMALTMKPIIDYILNE